MFRQRSFVLFVLALAAAVSDGVVRRRYECRSDRDCPEYHWCEVQVAETFKEDDGSMCMSFMNDRQNANKSCTRTSDDCAQREADRDPDMTDPEVSTQRCHRLTFGGHQCAKSYFMPCEGDGDCPSNFRCAGQGFSTGAKTVCKPVERSWWEENEVGSFGCDTDLDCGYDSVHVHAWNRCVVFEDGGSGCTGIAKE